MDSSEHDSTAAAQDAQEADDVQQALDEMPAHRAEAPDLVPDAPILSAMLAEWDGPAASLVGQHLVRTEPEVRPEPAPAPARAEPIAAAAGTGEPGRPAPLRIRVSGNGRTPVVTASGELSESTADLLAAPVQLCLLARPRQVSIDLSGVTAVTPGAVTTLLGLREAAQANDSKIELRAVSRPVREVLERAGAYETFRPGQPEPAEPAAALPMDPDMLEAEVLDGEVAAGKVKRSGEHSAKAHRRAARSRRASQVA